MNFVKFDVVGSIHHCIGPARHDEIRCGWINAFVNLFWHENNREHVFEDKLLCLIIQFVELVDHYFLFSNVIILSGT